jgi:hypothetical protein
MKQTNFAEACTSTNQRKHSDAIAREAKILQRTAHGEPRVNLFDTISINVKFCERRHSSQTFWHRGDPILREIQVCTLHETVNIVGNLENAIA